MVPRIYFSTDLSHYPAEFKFSRRGACPVPQTKRIRGKVMTLKPITIAAVFFAMISAPFDSFAARCAGSVSLVDVQYVGETIKGTARLSANIGRKENAIVSGLIYVKTRNKSGEVKERNILSDSILDTTKHGRTRLVEVNYTLCWSDDECKIIEYKYEVDCVLV